MAMENAKGGIQDIYCLTVTPHCRECGEEVKSIGALYRCAKGGCRQCGINKTAAEVEWK